MDPVSLIDNIIRLALTVHKKRCNVVSLREEIEEFCSIIEGVRSVLLDVQLVLKNERDGSSGEYYNPEEQTAQNKRLRRRLQGLQKAIKKGKEVMKECQQTQRLKAYIFSEEYLRKLRLAANHIRDNLQALQTVGIVLQVNTIEQIDQVSSHVSGLNAKIEKHHNELKQLITEQGESSERRMREIEILVRTSLGISNIKDLQEQAREITDNASELRRDKEIVDKTMLDWVMGVSEMENSSLSLISESIICPISLDVMEDPVMILQSGITYDHKHLCRSLLEHPDLEPVTGERYDTMITYGPNVTIRKLLMEQMGDDAYKRYDGEAQFKKDYRKAWNTKVVGDVEVTEEPSSSSPDGLEEAVAENDEGGDIEAERRKKKKKQNKKESIICPISLDIMEDPVMILQSGITYDHKHLCRSLLEHPDLEPVTGERYDTMITYGPNVTIRKLLMEQMGDDAYKRYDGEAQFKKDYRKAWNTKVVGDVEVTEEPSSSSPDGLEEAVAENDEGGDIEAERRKKKKKQNKKPSRPRHQSTDNDGSRKKKRFVIAVVVAIAFVVILIVVIASSLSSSGSSNSSSPEFTDPSSLSFTQRGQSMNGSPFDFFGEEMSMSADGKVLAVGANGNGAAYTRIHTFDGSRWNQAFLNTDEDAMGHLTDIALSSDGKTLAVGATNDVFASYTRVFRFDGTAWEKIGDLGGTLVYASVDVSSDGNILAIGSGVLGVVIYRYDEKTREWSPLGQTISGFDAFELFGVVVALSDDGTVLAAGAPHSNVTGTFSGQIRVFELAAGDFWRPLGPVFNGGNDKDYLGSSLSLSKDGRTLAALSSSTRRIQVYRLSDDGSKWNPHGNAVQGTATNYAFSENYALSEDGNTLVVADSFGDVQGEDSGSATLFQYDGTGLWNKVGQDLEGKASQDRFGWSVAVSGNGKIVASSAPGNDDNGEDSGEVKVFELKNCVCI